MCASIHEGASSVLHVAKEMRKQISLQIKPMNGGQFNLIEMEPPYMYLLSLLRTCLCHVNTLGGKNAWAVRVRVMLDGCWQRPCRQRRPCRQQCRKKNHLIEVAPFGRLDQMLRTTV